MNHTNLGAEFQEMDRFLRGLCILTHVVVGRRWPIADGAVLWWLAVLAIPRLPAGILRARVRSVCREGDEIYGGLTVLDGASPCLPLDLRLPITVAGPAEAGAE